MRLFAATVMLALPLFVQGLLHQSAKGVPQESKARPSKTVPKEIDQESARRAVKTNQQVIKRLMRAVHRGPYSPLVQLQSVAKSKEQPNWEKLAPVVEWVEIMGVALHEQPADKDERTYSRIANELKAAVKAKHQQRLVASIKQLSASCGRCHGWAPPK